MTRLLLLVVAWSLVGKVSAEISNQVNAQLPSQQMIWPLPTVETPIVVEASFVSSKSVHEVRQGDWITTTYLCIYQVDHVTRGEFSPKELRFFCLQRFPTPESGMMLKALAFVFRPKSHGSFDLEPSGDLYLIKSYHLK